MFMFFRTPSGLSQHKVTHRPPDKVPWPCDQCERVCATKAQLASHKKHSHDKKPCTFCGKMFTKHRMKEHVNSVHTEEHLKPFICQVCCKGFATQERLNTHMNIHTGNKPFVCKYCGRGFAGNLKNNTAIIIYKTSLLQNPFYFSSLLWS